MRRLLAIVLLALLPLQANWATVASYCAHEAQAGAAHLGHHEHRHQADPGQAAEATQAVTSDHAGKAPGDSHGNKAPGANDLDCCQCHGSCSAMIMLPAALPARIAAVLPHPTVDEDGGAHASTRPERPQWRPLA